MFVDKVVSVEISLWFDCWSGLKILMHLKSNINVFPVICLTSDFKVKLSVENFSLGCANLLHLKENDQDILK